MTNCRASKKMVLRLEESMKKSALGLKVGFCNVYTIHVEAG